MSNFKTGNHRVKVEFAYPDSAPKAAMRISAGRDLSAVNSKHAPAGVWLGEDCDCPHVRHLWLLDVLADMRRYARDAALVEFEQSLGRVSEGLIEEIRQRVQPGPGGIAK